jgi:hypothetical protein
MDNNKRVILVLSYLEAIFPLDLLSKIGLLVLDCLDNKLNKKEFINALILISPDLPRPPDIIYTTLICACSRVYQYYRARQGDVDMFTLSPSIRSIDICYKFCHNKVDKTYSTKQIEKMNNKQNLPVLFFGAGWGCYHIWEPNPFAQYETPVEKGIEIII